MHTLTIGQFASFFLFCFYAVNTYPQHHHQQQQSGGSERKEEGWHGGGGGVRRHTLDCGENNFWFFLSVSDCNKCGLGFGFVTLGFPRVVFVGYIKTQRASSAFLGVGVGAKR